MTDIGRVEPACFGAGQTTHESHARVPENTWGIFGEQAAMAALSILPSFGRHSSAIWSLAFS